MNHWGFSCQQAPASRKTLPFATCLHDRLRLSLLLLSIQPRLSRPFRAWRICGSIYAGLREYAAPRAPESRPVGAEECRYAPGGAQGVICEGSVGCSSLAPRSRPQCRRNLSHLILSRCLSVPPACDTRTRWDGPLCGLRRRVSGGRASELARERNRRPRAACLAAALE